MLGVIILVLYRYPDNHVARDPRLLWIVPAMSPGTLFAPWAERRVWNWFFPLLWIGCAALLYVMDELNLLLQYNEWIRRGMPGPSI